jgi:membrane associated rhomboid family serine protease
MKTAAAAWNGVATSSSPFRSRSQGDEDIAAPKPIPMEAVSRCVPWRLLAVGTFVFTLLPWFVPGIADVLVLDRERLMAGEFWRLFTHPWVHFSQTHLVVDLACILGLGIVAARRGVFLDWRGVLRFLAVIGLTGVTCLLLDPRLDRLGGLSGVNVAFAVWLGRGLWSRGDRLVAWVLLGGLGLKLVAEWAGWVTLVRFDEPGVEACFLSHWAAAAWGGLVCGLSSEDRVPPPGGGERSLNLQTSNPDPQQPCTSGSVSLSESESFPDAPILSTPHGIFRPSGAGS